MHNTIKYLQHNKITATRCIGQFLLCCDLFPLCCTNFVVLWLVSILLRLFSVVLWLFFHCVAEISLCCGLFPLCCVLLDLRMYFFWISNYLAAFKKVRLYSMNLCSMNVIWMYIRHVVTVMWHTSISFIASLLFTNPLSWPNSIVKCQSYVHFRTSPEIVVVWILWF